MDALFDVIPFVLFVLFVFGRLLLRGARSAATAAPTAPKSTAFDLESLLRALDEASTPEVRADPPPLPPSVAPPPTPAVTPMHSVGFDPSHFTEDDPFTEPGIFREVHLARRPPAAAPRRHPSARTGPLATSALQVRLRDPAALREAFVLQAILERRRR